MKKAGLEATWCLALCCLALSLSACQSSPQETGSMTIQNECVQIAERMARERCIEEAAFGRP